MLKFRKFVFVSLSALTLAVSAAVPTMSVSADDALVDVHVNNVRVCNNDCVGDVTVDADLTP